MAARHGQYCELYMNCALKSHIIKTIQKTLDQPCLVDAKNFFGLPWALDWYLKLGRLILFYVLREEQNIRPHPLSKKK
eukprot:6339411-Ditylum_brightwellii.AAC.1